jgi:superoxide dismutase, Cu-Zn family
MITTAAVVAAAAVATAAPGYASSGIPGGSGHPALTVAKFQNYRPGARAVTYDPRVVPPGAKVLVSSWPSADGRTTTLLDVHGLVPNRAYGAHVHTKRCGPDPNDAGPHFQNVPDPVQPSVDPTYANRHNEIWLDVTTDEQGDAHSLSVVGWQFARTNRHAQSVVIHTDHTHTDPGRAGQAGARVGCVDVDF